MTHIVLAFVFLLLLAVAARSLRLFRAMLCELPSTHRRPTRALGDEQRFAQP